MRTARLQIGYEKFGRGSRKAFFFHGFPGSRHQGRFLEPHCEALDLEIVAFDRPGYGLSESRGGGLSEVRALLEQLANQTLGWKRFHLLAVSGGAPYALHCASQLAERVESLHLVCGLGPLHEPEFKDAFPRAFHGMMHAARWTPTLLLDALIRSKLKQKQRGDRRPILPGICEIDRRTLDRPDVSPTIRESLYEAFHQGVHGMKADLRTYLSDWKLDWTSIQTPTHIWHGSEDALIPSRFSELFAERIPGARFTLIAGEGHYSLPIDRTREILASL